MPTAAPRRATLVPTLLLAAALLAPALAGAQIASGGHGVVQGDLVEVGIHKDGYLGFPAALLSTIGTGVPYHPHPASGALGLVSDYRRSGWAGQYGGDFATAGSGYEGFSVSWTGGAARLFSNFGGPAPTGDVVVQQHLWTLDVVEAQIAYSWHGEVASGAERLTVVQRFEVRDGRVFPTVGVQLINTGSVALTGLRYARAIDPSNDQSWGGAAATVNAVVHQPVAGGEARALVTATGTAVPGMGLGLGAVDPRAQARYGFAIGTVDPAVMLAASASGSAAAADTAIGLVWELGTLQPGQSASLEFAWIPDAAAYDAGLAALSDLTLLGPSGVVSGDGVPFLLRTSDMARTWKVDGYAGAAMSPRPQPLAGALWASFATAGQGTAGPEFRFVDAVATAAGVRLLETSTLLVDNSGPPLSISAPANGAYVRGNGRTATLVTNAADLPDSVAVYREVDGVTAPLGVFTAPYPAPFNVGYGVADLPSNTWVTLRAVGLKAGRSNTVATAAFVATACGDGVLGAGEQCDDGNSTAADGCSATCQLEPGWSCATAGAACATVCGDGILTGAEGCDDGNTGAGDGCSAACAVEAGFTCFVNPAAVNLVANGSFDAAADVGWESEYVRNDASITSAGRWTVTGNGNAVHASIPAGFLDAEQSASNRAAYFNGSPFLGALYQEVALTPGRPYVLSVAATNWAVANPASLSLAIGGVTLTTNVTPPYQTWQRAGGTFFAGAGAGIEGLQVVDAQGAITGNDFAVDAISLTEALPQVCGQVCAADADCAGAGGWCDTTAVGHPPFCAARLPDGAAIPSVPNRDAADPPLGGTCSGPVAAAVCASAACSVAGDTCATATATVVVSSIPGPVWGDAPAFTATVSAVAPGAGVPSGTVQFQLDGAPLGGPVAVAGGQATSPAAAGLVVGPHAVTASYGGATDVLASSSAPLAVTVGRAATATAATSAKAAVVFGEAARVDVAVTEAAPGEATGTVTVGDGGALSLSCALSGGQCSVDAAGLAVGSHALTASFPGDGQFLASDSAAAPLVVVVGRADTLASVAAVAGLVTGQQAAFTATVAAVAPGGGTPAGTVQFLLDGVPFGAPVALAGGQATSPASPALVAGSHTVAASYAGSTDHLPHTGAVNQPVGQAATVVAGASPAAVFVGEAGAVTATVAVVGPGAGTPTGTITFSDASGVLASCTLAGDSCTATLPPLPVGTTPITARYEGDAGFLASPPSPPVDLVVNQAATALVLVPPAGVVSGEAGTVSVTVAVSGPGAGTPGGTVTVLDGATVVGTCTLSAGACTAVLAPLPVGTHTLTAQYGGDPSFQGGAAAVPVDLVVSRASAALQLSGPAAVVGLGQPATLTATVAPVAPGAGTPTGTVTFSEGATVLGTAPLAAGQAQLTTSTLSQGAHTITASWPGDGAFLAPADATAVLTVGCSAASQCAAGQACSAGRCVSQAELTGQSGSCGGCGSAGLAGSGWWSLALLLLWRPAVRRARAGASAR